MTWEAEIYFEETCISAAASTTNPTWHEVGLNLDRRSEKPVTDRQGEANPSCPCHSLYYAKAKMCGVQNRNQ